MIIITTQVCVYQFVAHIGLHIGTKIFTLDRRYFSNPNLEGGTKLLFSSISSKKFEGNPLQNTNVL